MTTKSTPIHTQRPSLHLEAMTQTLAPSSALHLLCGNAALARFPSTSSLLNDTVERLIVKTGPLFSGDGAEVTRGWADTREAEVEVDVVGLAGPGELGEDEEDVNAAAAARVVLSVEEGEEVVLAVSVPLDEVTDDVD